MRFKLISQPKTIFWDFDGVIKDSIEVKTQAFVKLFASFGTEVAKRVCEHHLANGGMSRFDKLPIYLQWAGENPSPPRVSECCDQFGQMVLQGVVDAPWVPGAEAYLRVNPHQQMFVLVSATPQDELEQILQALNLTGCFMGIFGAPIRKQDAIRMMITEHGLDASDCLMIGDARADLEAAEANQIQFMLRRHETNAKVFAGYTGPSVKEFTAL